MLDEIVHALRARTDIQAWSVRRVTMGSEQLYAVPNPLPPDVQAGASTRIEARRMVHDERYVVQVLCQTTDADGNTTIGSGNATVLPGDAINTALDAAAMMAALVHNAPHTLPSPAPLPRVELAAPDVQMHSAHALNSLLARLHLAVAQHKQVRLTAAEWYAETQTTRLCNSLGIDAMQTETMVRGEWVLVCRDGERETEAFVELSRRRVADIAIEDEVARRAEYALDTLRAVPPPRYSGPVVLRDAALATFLNSGTLRTLSSGAAKYGKISAWEIGKTVFRGDVHGDPLTLFANRQLPFSIHANVFDDEGQPAQRVALIANNVLQTFWADQRYADYLDIEPTGAFGDLEIPAGSTPAAELLATPHVEVVAFSWFYPDQITGDFASEIRLGYLVEGDQRMPFKGGTLVGNVLDALADVRWSRETGFYGDYQGPTTVQFANLTVTGEGDGA